MNSFLEALNQLFEAGIAITAFSLLFRALTFSLQDRVSRAFAVILACIVIGFSGEVISGAVVQVAGKEAWLRFHWIGTIFIPAAYMHFSDALLETTGRPSRGRRLLVVRLAYLFSAAFLFTLPSSLLVGPLVPDGQPFPYLSRTTLSWVFTGYYAIVILVALHTIWRARRRTVLSDSHRRMTFLLGSSTALAIGAYPFLLLGSEFASGNPSLFLIAAALGNFLVFYSLLVMANATAFFGIAWPDRVIRSRLFKWLLRGPATVFVLLAIMSLVSRVAAFFGTSDSVVLPILIALSVLLILIWSMHRGKPIISPGKYFLS